MRIGRWTQLASLAVAAGVAGSGCSDEGGFTDSGTPMIRDAGFERPDGGVVDGPDGGGPRDTGLPPRDAGPPPDLGVPGAAFSERRVDDGIVHGQGVEIVDMNGDGAPDILTALSLDDAVHLYVNGGQGATFDRVVVGSNIVAMATAAADFDGDGDLDIAAVGLFDRNVGFSSPGEVTWFENPGDVTGSWTRREITGLTFWGPLYIAAGDLTGDGRPDLVVGAVTLNDPNGNPQGNGVHWFRNTGGDFAGPTAVDADLLEVRSLALYDVDGDGPLDILASGGGSDEVAWYENGRSGQDDNPAFTKHTVAQIAGPTDLELASIDGDADDELIVTARRGGGTVVYYDIPADPTGPWTENPVSDQRGGGERNRVFVTDLNGDGRTDIALAEAEFTNIFVLFQTEGGGFAEQNVTTGYTGLNWLTGGDMNGDGRPDLVTSTYEFRSGQDLLSWWENVPR